MRMIGCAAAPDGAVWLPVPGVQIYQRMSSEWHCTWRTIAAQTCSSPDSPCIEQGRPLGTRYIFPFFFSTKEGPRSSVAAFV